MTGRELPPVLAFGLLTLVTACGSSSSGDTGGGTSAPVISSFTATPESIQSGQSSTLSWSVTGAASLAIDQGVGAVTGTSRSVNPAVTTTYTLTATNSAGAVARTATIAVPASLPPPVITSFTASPSTISTGGSSTLEWMVVGATSITIDQGVGAVTGTSKTVSPPTSTTYTLTATNATGSASAAIAVTVLAGATAPSISSFTATPSTVTSGGSSTLSWSVTGATSISIDQGVGVVTGSNKIIAPTATTTYTLTATNLTASVTRTASVTVIPVEPAPPAISSFTATPTSIQSGQTATLSWSVTGATSLSIDQGIGAVTGTSRGVSPGTTTTYTLTATNSAGSVTGATTVAVAPAPANPAPSISSISPSEKTVGGTAFVLTVNGSDLLPSSIVRWGGSPRVTAYVDATRLTASITAADIGAAGTAAVTVFNPAPGGGTSSPVQFTASNPAPAAVSLSPATIPAGSSAFTLTVDGTGFVSTSTVQWNGRDRATSYVNATQLTASIEAADVATEGMASVHVVSPAPGGGASPVIAFPVTQPDPATNNGTLLLEAYSAAGSRINAGDFSNYTNYIVDPPSTHGGFTTTTACIQLERLQRPHRLEASPSTSIKMAPPTLPLSFRQVRTFT